MGDPTVVDAPKSLEQAWADARLEYDGKLRQIRTHATGHVNSSSGNDLLGASAAFAAAGLDLVKTGLDHYVEVAAADRQAMKDERKLAAEDLRSAATDRMTIRRLTWVIGVMAAVSGVATVFSAIAAFHSAYSPPKSPAFVNNIAAPVLPSPVVIPAPIVNVTIPGRVSKRK